MVEVAHPDCSTLRGAIVGFGNAAARAHLPAWQNNPRFTIDAVVEPHPERAEAARRLLPGARVHSDFEGLLNGNGLDFIDICTPPCYHVDGILAACRSGLHVFCEKPLAHSLEALQEIQEAARRTGRVVFTVNNWKYAPLWIRARELIRHDRIGAVRSITLQVLRPPGSGGGASDWRRCIDVAKGGILIDHGWHNLYVILSLIGEPPLLASARMEPCAGRNSSRAENFLEETVDLQLQFREAEAQLHLTWHAPCRRNVGVITGDKGALLVNDDHLIVQADGRPAERHDFPEALSASSHHPEWMKPVIDSFEYEIMNTDGRGANLAEARLCTQLIHMAYHSNREGSRPVHFPGRHADCISWDAFGHAHEKTAAG